MDTMKELLPECHFAKWNVFPLFDTKYCRFTLTDDKNQKKKFKLVSLPEGWSFKILEETNIKPYLTMDMIDKGSYLHEDYYKIFCEGCKNREFFEDEYNYDLEVDFNYKFILPAGSTIEIDGYKMPIVIKDNLDIYINNHHRFKMVDQNKAYIFAKFRHTMYRKLVVMEECWREQFYIINLEELKLCHN